MPARGFSDVRRKIRAQHGELRARLGRIVRNAERVDLPWAHAALVILFARFGEKFDDHLRFEDAELGPRVRELDAWGAAHEAALHAEHRDQRRRIAEVARLAEAPGAVDSYAFSEAVLELTDHILEDMAHEERTLAALARLDELTHGEPMSA